MTGNQRSFDRKFANTIVPSGQGPCPESEFKCPLSPPSMKCRSPGGCQVLRRFIAAIMVIAAADKYGRKGQRIARVGAESHQMLRADFWVRHIRRCDHEMRRRHFAVEVGNGVDHRWNSERMRDQQHRLLGVVHGLRRPWPPILRARALTMRPARPAAPWRASAASGSANGPGRSFHSRE